MRDRGISYLVEFPPTLIFTLIRFEPIYCLAAEIHSYKPGFEGVESSLVLDSPAHGKPLLSAAALLCGRALFATVSNEFGSGSSSVRLTLDVLGPHGRLVTVLRAALFLAVSVAEAMILASAHHAPAGNERSIPPPGVAFGPRCRVGLIVARSRSEQRKAAQLAYCLARL